MADISDSEKRPLPYPLKDTETIVGYSPDDGFSIIPLDGVFPDEDTRVSVRLELSLDEYVALASAVDVGRDIAYGEYSEWLWWIWVRAFRGASAEMSCEDVADCIETNETVQTALREQLVSDNDLYGTNNPDKLSPAGTESTIIINNRFPPAGRAQSPIDPPVGCDLDQLWAGIYFMVQQLDNVGRDWLEQAVASGDKWQRAASIAKNIPIIGSLASTALEQLAEVAQDLLNLYNGYSTEAALQDIACHLFELVCDECRYPTYDEIAGYYGANSTITGGNLAEISLKAMVDFLIGSSLAISQLAYHTIISMVLFTLWMGSEFVGLRGAQWIAIWLDNGEEYANDEWEVLCDGCDNPIWCYEWDFTASNGNWTLFAPYPPAGVYVAGVGWQYTDVSNAGYIYRGVMLRSNLFTNGVYTLTEVEVEMEYEYGHFTVPFPNSSYKAMRFYASGDIAWWTAQQAAVPSFSGNPVTHTRDLLPSGWTGTIGSIAFEVMSSNDNQAPVTASGTVTVKRLRIKGGGTMPPFTGGQAC